MEHLPFVLVGAAATVFLSIGVFAWQIWRAPLIEPTDKREESGI